MHNVDRQVDKVLTLLQDKIRGRGFTQLQIQEALGWGRSYISQLVTKQKSLRIEQVLLILQVIGIEPAEFFAELFLHAESYRSGTRFGSQPMDRQQAERAEEMRRGIDETRTLLSALVDVLDRRGLVSREELADVPAADRG